MTGFTKLFSSIVTSTIWCESKETKIVWITMLALADQRGFVDGTIPGLAAMARVTVDECRQAVAQLLAPDPDSRSKENNGRRIEAVDGGWVLLNHAKYRAKLSADERRAYKTSKQREYRGQSGGQMWTNVDNVDTGGHKQKQRQSTEAEAFTPFPLSREGSGRDGVLAAKKRIGAIFKRKTEAPWANFEESTLCQLFKRPGFQEELVTISGAYDRKQPFMSQSVERLLQDWTANLDRATNHGHQYNSTAADKIVHGKELERIECRISAIRQQYSGMQTWNAEDRAESRTLKERREVLRKMLGVTI